MTVWNKNLQDDYGAPCAGEVDDSYFADFRTFALSHPGDEFVLDFPASSTITTTTSSGDVFRGIGAKLTVNGNGSTWTGNGIGLGSGGIGTNDSSQDGWYGAFTETVTIDDTVITLLPTSDQLNGTADTSLFLAGSLAAMTGFDLQGQGAPASPGIFEFVRIVSVNSGARTVTATAPLRKQYKKTWPSFDVYPTSGILHGGPATLFRIPAIWDTEFIYNGLTFVPVDVGQEIYCKVRKATFNNCTSGGTSGASGFSPSGCQTLIWNNVSIPSAFTECDKLVESFTINGGSFNSLHFASMSGGDQLTINNAAITTLGGIPRRAALSGCTIGTLHVSPAGYGCLDDLALEDCDIADWDFTSSQDVTIAVSPNTMTSGVITASKDVGTHTPTLQTMLPGKHYVWGTYSGGFVSQGAPCTITDYTDQVAGVRDASNLFITTDLAGGFPSVSAPKTIALCVVQNSFSCTNCTGSDQSVVFSQPGAQNKPLGSYSKRTTSSFASGATSGSQHLLPIYLMGYVTSIEVDVTTAYSGSSGSASLRLRSDSDNNKQIDLKTTGKRTITQTDVTNDQGVNGGVGGLGGDSLTAAGAGWFFEGTPDAERTWYSPNIGAETADKWPAFTITIATDQGFSFPDAAPPLITPMGRGVAGIRLHL